MASGWSRSSSVIGRWSWRSPASPRTAPRSGSVGPSWDAQPEPFAGSELWIVPNPSGLNAHETIDTLAVAYRAPANAAGVV